VKNHTWLLYQHAAFKEQLQRLINEVEKIKDKALRDSHPKAKILKHISKLIEEEIPANPNDPRYLLGNTLGRNYRHWRRAKFLQRFRLFFRFSEKEKIIIYAWINDENSLRKVGARTDPYAIFLKRLRQGNPPDSWVDLIKQRQDL
jgi:toxin YhaV